MLVTSNKDHSHGHSHNHKHDLPLHKITSNFEPEINTFAHFKQHISRDKDAKKLCILLMINLVVTVLEVVYGFISNSIGLISDAAHMLFDSTALAVGIYASYKAKLPANKKFSYGYERFQTLAGFINGIFLIFIAFYILIESLERIYDPPVIHSEQIIVVAIIGLVVNLIGVIFFHEHAHSHGGEGHSHSHGHDHSHSHSHKKQESHEHSHNHSLNSTSHVDSSVPSTQNSLKEPTSLEDTDKHHHHGNGCNHHDHELEQLHQPSQNPSHHHHHDDEHEHDHDHDHEDHHDHHHHDHGPNENLYGVFLHILADLLGSVGVIASSILIMLFGWYITDAICSAITSVLILVSVIPLLKSSVMVFMQTYPSKHEKQFTQILADISNHPAVLECKDPHLWAFTHEKLVCSMILVLRHNTPDVNKVVRFAKDKLNQIRKIKYITIDYKVDKH
jgi:zinc transporter 5/7